MKIVQNFLHIDKILNSRKMLYLIDVMLDLLLILAVWHHMTTEIRVNIGSGNG